MDLAFSLEQRFCRAMRDECVVPRGSRLLVAVSGGPDSVALLRLLCRAAVGLELELMVAHLDHGMRTESADDAAFVRALSETLQLPAIFARISVPERAAASKCGLEEAARDARREFLLQTAAVHGCALVALGHQRDDQAETVLHRLVRGTGATGLAAMRARCGNIIRPLLGFTRQELVAYLRMCEQPFVVDASNSDPRFTRNRLRQELLPLLESFNPKIAGHLAGLSRRLALEEDYWRAEVENCWPGLLVRSEGGLLVLDRLRLLALHPALRARVLRHALREAKVGSELGSVHLAAVEKLLLGERPQGELHLFKGWVARRYDELWLSSKRPEPVSDWALQILAPGEYLLPGRRLLRVAVQEHPGGENRCRVEFAADQVGFPLVVRTARPGDCFRPSGSGGRKKLKDYFIAARAPYEVRRSQLLVAAKEVLWLVGRRRCSGLLPIHGATVLSLEVL